MTTRELLLECAEDSNLNGTSLHPRVRERLLRYLNQGLRRVLAMPGMHKLTESDPASTFTTVADQARYVLPESVALIRGLTERTNDTHLTPMSLGDYRRLAPDPSEVTGTPEAYVLLGRVALATLLSDASEVFVKSTSSADVSLLTVRGTIDGGYQREASVTLTGTTAVSVSSGITSWVGIDDLFLSAAAVGTITLHEDSGSGTELARITCGQTRPRYQGLLLYPTPSEAVAYTVDTRRRTIALVSDDDEPPWDEDFHWVLSSYARMRQYEKANDARYEVAKTEWEQGTRQLRAQTLFPPGYHPIPTDVKDEGSNLGAWYPRGRW